MEHTKGPWQQGEADWFHIYAAEGRVADVRPDRNTAKPTAAEMQANARLIAAAPDLLAMLERVVWLIEYVPDLTGIIKPLELKATVEALISKTKGE